MSKNTQIDVYLEPREPKEHEKRMLNILGEHFQGDPGRIIDIGCARGTFLNMLVKQHPKSHLTGIDCSQELINEATKTMTCGNVKLMVADALQYSPSEPFDAAIASGVLSIFDDFERPLDKWLSWLKKNGILFVFGCFNSRNIDTIIKFRNNEIGNTDWEGGLTSYSKKTVSDYLADRECSFHFERFEISLDIPKTDDPITGYTVPTADGRKLLVTGANNVYELWFLVIKKQHSN